MQSYEDDDDTHFCIKCHSTINGLDNYVRHRQSGCRAQETKQSEAAIETPPTPTVTYPEILNADAFFSSLELQSSTKPNPALRARGRASRERRVGRVVERGKKKGRKGQEPEDGVLKDKLLNMPPVVADLDDLMDHIGIPSLVGFPEIVTTTKPSATTSVKSAAASSTKLNNQETLSASPVESIIANSKSCTDRKRSDDPQKMEQDQGDWSDDTTIVDLDTNSENKEGDAGELTNYPDSDYPQDEESNNDSVVDDIDDNESYSNDYEPEDREFPPRGHTGGKWKPSGLLQDINRLNENETIEEDDNLENPPAQPTGGKWKPTDNSQRVDENELAGKEPGGSSSGVSAATTGRQATPGHTRGKWIPGAPGDFGSGYWCDPCGRKLASRLLYNRHLLSDLHARRSIQEIDGDLQLPRGLAPLLRRKSTSKRQRALAEIKSRTKKQSQERKRATRKQTRRRQKEVLVCEMCEARVRRPQMGKHLLSHYHCRVAGTNPCSSPTAQRFILENMSNVVRQCPFQCSICRFYCNTEATFLRHWRSTLHTSKSDDVGGSYKCNACNFYCDDNDAMEEHLTGSGHRELIAMMNGSVPIVVGRQTFLICKTCDQRFRYNLQLRFHARVTGHSGNVTATDEYQSRISCGQCSQVVRSLVGLQRHLLSCHGRKAEIDDDDPEVIAERSAPYFCSFCIMNFKTAREAVLHRRTLSHKEIVKAQKIRAENSSSVSRNCPYCEATQSSLPQHKEHLLQHHPEMCHRCPRCGLLFALPQDVTRHTRDVECEKADEGDAGKAARSEGQWKCTNCSFTTDSQAEFLFHDALHAGSIAVNTDEPGYSKTTAKYRCPMCEKYFPKVTLRNHIRRHTGERPFRCIKCSLSFTRRSSLNMHRKECPASTSWPNGGEGFVSRRRKYVCSECNAAFFTKQWTTRYVSYRETYKKRVWGVFWKTATRINYRIEGSWKLVTLRKCCDGYSTLSVNPLTCLAVCRAGCPGGRCIELNVCECFFGYRNPTLRDRSTCVPNCDGRADNPKDCGKHGRCIAPETCQCFDGYSEKVESLTYRKLCEPKCDPACGVHGFCHGPNDCRCDAGYRLASTSKSSKFQECEPICENGCVNGVCQAPNTCTCLPGYKQDVEDHFVCQPVCKIQCIHGDCTKPDHCECHPGYEKTATNPTGLCSPICDLGCINGICTRPNYCECHKGYKAISTHSNAHCLPICDPPCINGVCTRPGVCTCHVGHSKNANEPHNECSPVCDPPCINGECTGPNHCECHQHYEADPNKTDVCLPVCDPLCINGSCVKPDTCQCLDGYGKSTGNPFHVCSPICDPLCINGACTEPGVCTCHVGHRKNASEHHHECSPVCDPLCINGSCVGPDTCECSDGYGKSTEKPSHVCSPICDPPCLNAHCVGPNHCVCFRGYEFDPAGSMHQCLPVCNPVCINATCQEPNVCQCHVGYSKSLQGPPEHCSPVCDPPCDLNSFCHLPNQCICNDGYIKDESFPLNNSIVCQPVCQPDCIKNATCVTPNQCQCQPGYQANFSSDQQSNPTECLPLCEKDCLNGFCGYPNKCVCHLGYRKSLVDEFTCDPHCEHDCINAKCIRPNYCECLNGYEKAESIQQEQLHDSLLTDNICIPRCPADCLSCMAPNQCFCHPGYVLKDSELNSSAQSCEPSCEPACPPDLECVAPNQCQLPVDINQNDTAISATEPDVFNSTDSLCPTSGNFLQGNETCDCKNGWTGPGCDEPTFCIMKIMNDNETGNQFYTRLRHALRQHTMRHAGKNFKCGLPGCPTILRTENELRSHRRLVHETTSSNRSHRCTECPYSAKTKTQLRRHQTRHVAPAEDENTTQQSCPFSHCNFTTKISSHLRRHVRLHTGTKPYKCRHCTYASNNLENLRKHVLSTSLHPGKTIYECDVCIEASSSDPYCTNFAKELRAHLLEAHPRDFPRPSDASDHVAKIFKTDGEAGSPTPYVNNPYGDSITAIRHDHDYKC